MNSQEPSEEILRENEKLATISVKEENVKASSDDEKKKISAEITVEASDKTAVGLIPKREFGSSSSCKHGNGKSGPGTTPGPSPQPPVFLIDYLPEVLSFVMMGSLEQGRLLRLGQNWLKSNETRSTLMIQGYLLGLRTFVL